MCLINALLYTGMDEPEDGASNPKYPCMWQPLPDVKIRLINLDWHSLNLLVYEFFFNLAALLKFLFQNLD